MTDVRRARRFEQAMRQAGRPIEAKYYESAGHNGFFEDDSQYADEVHRMAAFIKRHLSD